MDKYNKLREIKRYDAGNRIGGSTNMTTDSGGKELGAAYKNTDLANSADKKTGENKKPAGSGVGGIWGAVIDIAVKDTNRNKDMYATAKANNDKKLQQRIKVQQFIAPLSATIGTSIAKLGETKETGPFGIQRTKQSKFGDWFYGKKAKEINENTFKASIDKAKQDRMDGINAQTAAMYAKKGIKLKKTKDKEPELRIVNPGIKIHNIGYMTKSWKPGATLAKHGTKLEHKSCGCGSHGDMLEKLDGGTINLIRKTIGMGEGPVTKRFADAILKDAGSEKGIYDFLQKLLKDHPKNQEIVIKVAKEGGNIQPIFKSGGKIKDHRVLTGVYHSQKNNLDLEVTKKGIPVVSFEDGGEVTQHAEVEKNELVLNKEASETIEKTAELIEELPEEKEDEMLLRFGKWLVVQLLKNTENLKAVS